MSGKSVRRDFLCLSFSSLTSYDPCPGHAHAGKLAAPGRVRARCGRRGGSAAASRVPWSRRRPPPPGSAHSGVCDSKLVPSVTRERSANKSSVARWRGRSRRPIRRKSIASTSTRRRCGRCSAPCSRSFRFPTSCSSTRFACRNCRWQRGVVHGDRRCSAIAAASIVAKVTRDRQMLELHGRDPRYGFDRHKGYATADHLEAVARFGYSDVHRRSFRAATLFDTIE